jgi:hypothetical protein
MHGLQQCHSVKQWVRGIVESQADTIMWGRAKDESVGPSHFLSYEVLLRTDRHGCTSSRSGQHYWRNPTLTDPLDEPDETHETLFIWLVIIIFQSALGKGFRTLHCDFMFSRF